MAVSKEANIEHDSLKAKVQKAESALERARPIAYVAGPTAGDPAAALRGQFAYLGINAGVLDDVDKLIAQRDAVLQQRAQRDAAETEAAEPDVAMEPIRFEDLDGQWIDDLVAKAAQPEHVCDGGQPVRALARKVVEAALQDALSRAKKPNVQEV
ncbi:unnamed protein product [Prorocentrum cordatum]|uniref:Uncharacterized protein n=1 Tax=Prorocentrum cordatum TaxID=2364126 RepID=A0ABN9TVX7_9DINO|nr:unnamed protein product [Polarella glacialis]